MKIEEYEKKYIKFAELHKDNEFVESHKSTELNYYKKQLSRVLSVIETLESFYMSNGFHYYNVSENFRNEAHKERQELCRESSALYELIRKFEEVKK